MLKKSWKELSKNDFGGEVLLLPTDTIYGFHGLSGDQMAQNKIKLIKNRGEQKYFINLIARISDIEKFDIQITRNQKKFLKKIWPGRVTIILKNTVGDKISFRVPAHGKLRKFIKKVGPLISTSANVTSEVSIIQPQELSSDLQKKIDFYIDEGKLKSGPSTVLEIVR